jgi:hypothetical protein
MGRGLARDTLTNAIREPAKKWKVMACHTRSKKEKQYSHPKDKVTQATIGAVEGLEGKVVSQDDATGKMVAQFNKTILGKVLGERTQVKVTISAPVSGEISLDIEAYPLDAIGRKLMFGTRKGFTRRVLDWFNAHLENRL